METGGSTCNDRYLTVGELGQCGNSNSKNWDIGSDKL